MVIDCQSDLLEHLNTRFVVPLIPVEKAPAAAKRLNPVFSIGSDDYAMVTQFAAAVDGRELGEVVASLRERGLEVVSALDVLVSGV